MIATLIWMLAVASVPPVYTTSQLGEGAKPMAYFDVNE